MPRFFTPTKESAERQSAIQKFLGKKKKEVFSTPTDFQRKKTQRDRILEDKEKWTFISAEERTVPIWPKETPEMRKKRMEQIKTHIKNIKSKDSSISDEEAKMIVSMWENKVNLDNPNYEVTAHETDSALDLSVLEREDARDQKIEAEKTVTSFAKKMRKRWDESVKKNLDVVMKLWNNPEYMKWLWVLWISPDAMMSLQQGREAYVQRYADEMRKSFDNDMLWFDNLKGINRQAEKEFLRLSGIVDKEVKRISENKDERIWQSVNDQWDVSVLFIDKNNNPYTRVFPWAWKTSATWWWGIFSAFSGLRREWELTETQQIESRELTTKLKAIPDWLTYNPKNRPITEDRYGECWAFINDVTGNEWLMGNTYEEKKDIKHLAKYWYVRVNEPQVNWIFVSNIWWESWHAWIIIRVYKDETWKTLVDVRDQNKDNKWKVQTRIWIDPNAVDEKMTDFFVKRWLWDITGKTDKELETIFVEQLRDIPKHNQVTIEEMMRSWRYTMKEIINITDKFISKDENPDAFKDILLKSWWEKNRREILTELWKFFTLDKNVKEEISNLASNDDFWIEDLRIVVKEQFQKKVSTIKNKRGEIIGHKTYNEITWESRHVLYDKMEDSLIKDEIKTISWTLVTDEWEDEKKNKDFKKFDDIFK